MGTTSNKLSYLLTTKNKLKTAINYTGANITNDTFRSYPEKLYNAYIDILNKGTQELFDSLPKVQETGTSITLNNTKEAPMKLDLKGNTYQDGEPTPDSPVDVNVVSGDNTIRIQNRNLAEFGTTKDISNYTYNSYLPNNIDVEKTTTGGSFFASFILHIPSAGIYNITGNIASNQQIYIYNDDLWGTLKESFSISTTGDFTRPTTFNEAGTYILGLYGSQIRTYSVKNFMCLKNQTSPSTYIEHQGQSQLISLGVENLISKIISTQTLNGVTLTSNGDGTYTLNGTATANTSFNIYDGDLTLEDNTYFLNGCPSGGSTETYKLAWNVGGNTSNDFGNGVSYTGSATNKAMWITIYSGYTCNNLVFKPQIIKGNKWNSFTPYGATPIWLGDINDYEDKFIRTSGKNLFDKENASILAAYIDTNIIDTSAKAKTTYISCKPNTTYTISKTNKGNNNRFTIATTTSTPALNVAVSQYNNNNSASTMTITTNSTANYLCLTFYHTDETSLTMQQVLDSIQIEQNNQATEYNPFGSDEWYLKKEIGKLIPKSGYGIQQYENNTYIKINRPSNAEQGFTSDKVLDGYCSIGQWKTGGHTWNSKITGLFIGAASAQWWIGMGDVKTQHEIDTYVENNDIEILFILVTPTYTKIEGTLKDQLEAIKKSYDEQTNISQTNNDLPFVISASAIKEYE